MITLTASIKPINLDYSQAVYRFMLTIAISPWLWYAAHDKADEVVLGLRYHNDPIFEAGALVSCVVDEMDILRLSFRDID